MILEVIATYFFFTFADEVVLEGELFFNGTDDFWASMYKLDGSLILFCNNYFAFPLFISDYLELKIYAGADIPELTEPPVPPYFGKSKLFP